MDLNFKPKHVTFLDLSVAESKSLPTVSHSLPMKTTDGPLFTQSHYSDHPVLEIHIFHVLITYEIGELDQSLKFRRQFGLDFIMRRFLLKSNKAVFFLCLSWHYCAFDKG